MSFVRGKKEHGGIEGNLAITTTSIKHLGFPEYPEVYLFSLKNLSPIITNALDLRCFSDNPLSDF